MFGSFTPYTQCTHPSPFFLAAWGKSENGIKTNGSNLFRQTWEWYKNKRKRSIQAKKSCLTKEQEAHSQNSHNKHHSMQAATCSYYCLSTSPRAR
jgi:hypothetical protein